MAFADWCLEHLPSSQGAEAWALWQLIPLPWVCVICVLSSAFGTSSLCFMCPPHQMVTKVVSQLQTSSSVVHVLMQNQDSPNHTSTSLVAPWWIRQRTQVWGTERSDVPSCVTHAPMSDTQTTFFTMAVALHSGTCVGSSFQFSQHLQNRGHCPQGHGKHQPVNFPIRSLGPHPKRPLP